MTSFVPIRLTNRTNIPLSSLYQTRKSNLHFRNNRPSSNNYKNPINKINNSQSYRIPNDYINNDNSLFKNTNDHISDLLRNETNLKIELSNKNKKINEYEELLKIQEHQIEELKENNNSLYNKLNEVCNSNNNLIKKNKQYELDITNYDHLVNNAKCEREKYEKEIKIYSKKINELHDTEKLLKNYKNKNSLIEQENSNLIKENERINFDNNVLKDEINSIQKEKSNIDSLYKQLKRDFESLKNTNSKLYEDNETLNNEIENLNNKLLRLTNSKEKNENELKNLNCKIQKTEDENIYNKNNFMKVISYSNENIDNISRWIEHFLSEIYNENIEIPNLKINDSIREVNFNKLKNHLINAKNKIDNNINKLENENKNLRYTLTLNQDENFKNQKYLENLFNTIKYEIEKNDYFKIDIKKQVSLDINYKLEIEKVLKNIFDILYKIKDANPENLIDKLREENDNLKKEILEFEKLKNFSFQQNLEIKDLKNENYKLKEQLKITDEIKQENKKLKDEIDIKNSMINNQRIRLEKKDEKDLIIEQLEKDKDNLLKDNIILIKDNGSLKQKLNILQFQIKQSENTSEQKTRYSNEDI